MNLMAQVIEDQHAIEKHQHAIGHIEIVFGLRADVLQLPHNVIGAIPDSPRRKRRQPFDRRWTVLPQQFFHHLKDVAGAAFHFASALDRDLRTARLQPQKRPHAQERIASNLFSALNGLEQERVRLALGDSQECRHRCQ